METNNPGGRDVLPDASKGPLTGLRILLAEDEGLVALELQEILGDFGCKVIGPLATVDKVLERAQGRDFDGALLDVNLRGRQIFEILPALLALRLPLILTSGYDDASFFPPPFRAVPRLAKPFDEGQLRRICERVFAEAATRAAR